MYLYPLDFSLQNLAAFSTSSLALHVRRTILMRPQFEEAYRAKAGYMKRNGHFCDAVVDILREDSEDSDTYELDHDRLFDEEDEARQVARDYIDLNHAPEVDHAHERYVELLNEQKRLLESGTYVEFGAHLISCLPNLTSAVINGGPGYHNASSWCEFDGGFGDFISARFPEVNFRTAADDGAGHCESFLPYALRMLSLASPVLLELATTRGITITPAIDDDEFKCIWQRLRLYGLRSLRLDLDSDYDATLSGCALQPIIQSANETLHTLDIGRNSYYDPSIARPVIVIEPLFGQVFPVLEELCLRPCFSADSFSTAALVQFLRRHETLCRLHITGLVINRCYWRTIFGILRGRRMEWSELIDCRPEDSNGDPTSSFSVSTDGHYWAEEWSSFIYLKQGATFREDLRKYITGEASWTRGLCQMFGDVSA